MSAAPGTVGDAPKVVVVDRVDAWWHPLHACRRPRSGTVAAMERLIACEAMTWAAPGGPAKAIDVAWCESRLRPAALNPTGCSGAGCGGLFQQQVTTFLEGLPPLGRQVPSPTGISA